MARWHKGICECKYRSSNYFDIEAIIKQTLSAKRFVKADQACIATNYAVQNKDAIYKKTGVIMYDRIMLQRMDTIRGGNGSLEEQIKKIRIKHNKSVYKRV